MARIVSIGKTAMIEFTADEIIELRTQAECNPSSALERHLARVFRTVNEALTHDLFQLTSHSNEPTKYDTQGRF